VNTGELTLDQSVQVILKQLTEGGIIKNNTEPHIVDSLVETISEEELANLATLKSIDIEVEQAEYLQTIGQGWAYPLQKFMDEIQLLEVLHMKTITDVTGKRHLLSVPITQHVTKEQADALKGEKQIALKCSALGHDGVYAVIENPVFFENRKEEISARTFGTLSVKHPKVERIMAQGDFLVSGSKMRFVREVKFNDGLDQYRQTPRQIHNEILARGADAVYAFQVRNPLHNGHVILLKDTRE
jgi:3'-phosphoadenosine 5'-phosphosulfate synthase